MTRRELYLEQIKIQKQWIFMLINYSEEDLHLPKGETKNDAIDKALDEINYFRNLIKLLDDES